MNFSTARILAALLVAASPPFTAAMLALSASSVVHAQQSDTKYIDKNAFFVFAPPPGWHRRDYPDESRSKVEFTDPRSSAYIRLIVQAETESTSKSFASDKREVIESMKRQAPVKILRLTQIPGTFMGHPAYFVRMSIPNAEIEQTFFLASKLQFNIWYEARDEGTLKSLRPVVTQSLESIQVKNQGTTKQAKEHQSANALRLGQLSSAHGDFSAARQFIEEGLKEDPSNARLKKALDYLNQSKVVPSPLP